MIFKELTVKDRVLFFLLDFLKETLLDVIDMDTDYVVKSLPSKITQEGIAESVGIRWNHASRALKELIGMGLVEMKKANIEGGRRVRLVYFLTPEGFSLANEVSSIVNNKEFEILKEGVLERMTFSQIHRQYGKGMSFFDFFVRFERIFSNIVAEGDIVDNVHFTQAIEQIGRIHHHVSLPVVDMIGRDNEVGLIEDIFKEGPNSIVIIGLPGMGKTTLISAVLSQCQEYETLYYPVHEWDSARSVLMIIASFLKSLNKLRLRDYLKGGSHEGDITRSGQFDFWEVNQIISEDLNGEKAILTFDDYQKASEEVKKLLSMVYSMVSNEKSLHMCILSRETPDFYSQKEVIAEKKVYELVLKGIDYNSMKELLDRRGNVDRALYPTIFQITGGHPLAVNLIGSSEGVEVASNLTKYIRNEVLMRLEPRYRSLLRSVSVYRKPVGIDIIVTNDEDVDILDKLMALSLMSETGSKVALHDVVRSVVYENLPTGLRQELHLKAAENFIDSDTENLVEVFYHLMAGNDGEKAIELLEEYLPQFIESGHARDIGKIIDETEVFFHDDYKVQYEVLKLEIFLSLGKYQKTKEVIKYVNESGFIKNSRLRNKSRIIIGRRYYYDGLFNESISTMDEIISRVRKKEEIEDLAEALHWKGKAHTRRGEREAARKALQEALLLSEEVEDNILKARVLMALSFVSDDDIECALDAEEIFERVGDFYDLAEAKNHVGRLYYLRGDLDFAQEKWSQGIRIGESTGNFGLTAVMQFNMASVLIDKGELESALDNLKECTRTFYSVNFVSGFVYSKVGYGAYYAKRNKYDIAERFLNRGEELALELEDEKTLELVYTEKCNLFEKMGDRRKLKQFRKKLKDIQS